MVDFKNLSTEEKEKITEWFKNYSKKLEESHLLTKKIISNDEYINWLISFTEKYSNFCDDSWLYCPEEITDDERNQVNALNNFFEAIDNYANMNYLPYNATEFGHTYFVRHNDIVLEVGMAVGQGTLFYVSRKNEVLDNVIEFKDVQAGQKTKRAQKIDSIFTRLEGVVEELVDEKVLSNTVLVKTNEILSRSKK